jgi:hypothetical protein
MLRGLRLNSHANCSMKERPSQNRACRQRQAHDTTVQEERTNFHSPTSQNVYLIKEVILSITMILDNLLFHFCIKTGALLHQRAVTIPAAKLSPKH